VAVKASAVPPELVAAWRDAGLHGTGTIGQRIAATGIPGAITFSTDGGERTASRDDLVSLAGRYAAGLAAAGVRTGDVVAIQLPSSADSWALVGGAWLRGAVVCPIVDIYGPNELGFILRESGARLLAVSASWRGRSGIDVARSCGFDDTLLAAGADLPPDVEPVEGLLDHGTAPEPVAVDADDLALLVYTSGTTAAPKGVQHTHNTLLAGFHGVATAVPGPPSLATFPAGHIAGALSALRALVAGGDAVVMDRWSATRAAALIERHGVGFAAGTPFFLQGLLDAAERDGRDISSLGTFLTGAAPVAPALLERAAARGILGWRTYGSTEHPGISSGGPTDDEATRHGTDGRVSPLAEVRLVDEELRDVPAGEEGEIVVRGPKQFIGYRDHALDEDAFLPDGWFRTGDVGRLDDQRRLTITDRRKDIIIRGGENISSKEVEDVVARIPTVVECAVCAQPDPALGEIVAAFVRLSPGMTLTLDDVRAHFEAAGVPSQKAPEALHVVDDLPRTAAGKVLKAQLRASLR
jgi:acyl-CoA synthetase (AMP-forming)/AMP-acid ligase II